MTRANLKSRYRKTFAGFIWVVLNPVILFGVHSLVFQQFLKLEVPNYLIFLLTGLLPWIFMLQSLEMCTSIFKTSGALLKAYPAHPLVYLTSQLADNLINFLAAFVLILVPLLSIKHFSPLGFFLLPLPIMAMAIGVFGMAWWLATAQVFWGDTRYIVSFAMNVTFLLTPVFYPVNFIPEYLRWIVVVNPFYHLIAPFRIALYEFHLELFMKYLMHSFVVSIFLLLSAAWFWKKKKNEFYLYV
ncbi:MAG: ABC transporter permease [Oligoflexia bacterium]|nr:ABC transporter permease [Oligoflexia bacterium]